ncbi:MAG: VOC family protein [Candidatus Binatus sp.]|uniref:VOC family protein n=1 Tax=Candidatus Binatus sp. TaxID=2811406 RepID=UPI0027279FCF|nr:VOC family protein [Candidatus Binatus sp.]MDO8432183.1 VOC family protein [Candidatus Binatus sp.]
MFRIGKLFHLTQVVSDLGQVDKFYDDVFAVTRFYHGYAKAAGRDASLIAIGEVIMEPMTPARVANLRNQSVKRFHDRFGQHLHSIAWYVDDVAQISTHLDQHRLRLFDVTGNRVTPPNEKFAVWTHPKETHGQLEFAVIGANTIDPRLQPAWSNEYWRERHPLGIERASHITAVVRDVSLAKKFYVEVLGAKLIDERSVANRKQSAFVAVGEDTVVELAQPTSSNTPEGQDLERNGEGFFALTFKTRNLAKAAEFLKSKHLRAHPEGVDSITLGPDQAFGMTIGFTERSLPNDPRDN